MSLLPSRSSSPFRRRLGVTVALSAAAVLFAGCRGTSVKVFEETLVDGAPASRTTIPLRYGGGLPLRSWNPNGQDGWCEATALLHARLFQVDGQGRVAPDLVLDATPSDDGLSWRLRLRSGARFHDDQLVTADDVVATWRAVLAEPASGLRHLLLGIGDMVATAPDLVDLRLPAPFPEVQEALTEMAILPARFAADPAALEREPVGAGPYRLVARGPQWFEFQAWPGYHLGRVACPAVDLRVIEDDQARARALARGELDLTVVKAASLELFADAQRFSVRPYPSGAVRCIPLDVRAPGLDDARVRRALSALVDRDGLVREALGGFGRPVHQMLAPENPAFERALERPALDAAGARALLSEAGFVAGASGRLERNGAPLRVRLVAWQGESFRRLAAERIVAAWCAAGVDATVIPVDHAGYQDFAANLSGRAEGYVAGFGGTLGATTILARKFSAAGGQNRVDFQDAVIEARLAEAAIEPRLGRRVELLREVLRRLDELVPWIPLVTPDNLVAHTSRIASLPFTVADSWYELPRHLWKLEVGDPR